MKRVLPRTRYKEIMASMAPPLLVTLRLGSVLLLLPVLELLFSRFYLHGILGLRIGFYLATDFDFIFPLPTAFFIVLHVLSGGGEFKLRFSLRRLAYNLALFCSFLFLSLFFVPQGDRYHLPYLVVWGMLLSAYFVTAFFVWVEPGFFFRNRYSFVLVPGALISLSIFLYRNVFPALGTLIKPLTVGVVDRVLHLVFRDSATLVLSPMGNLRITHELFTLRIGQGCMGGDAFFYFTCVFLVWVILKTDNRQISRCLMLFWAGLLMMFCLNVTRVVFLYAIGIFIMRHWSQEWGQYILMGLFHLHAGWVLYSIGILVFVSWSSLGLRDFWQLFRGMAFYGPVRQS